MDLNTFEKEWLKHFAAEISDEDMQKYVVETGNYIWHIFSWKLMPKGSFLYGDEARAAYDRIEKKGAVLVDAFQEEDPVPLPAEYECAAALEEFEEVYVAAPDFSWTYIKTHEGDFCGPYFCRK